MIRYLICACVTLLVGIAPMANATVLVSEDFGTVSGGTYVSGQAVGPVFTLTSGNVDVLAGGFFGALCVTGTTQPCVDLNGSAPGSLASSSIVLAAGNYVLSFILNGSQRGVDASTTVTLGALFTQTYVTPSATLNNLVTQAITVASNTTAVLSFSSNTPGAVGSILDNISLATAGAPGVPEPSSSVLLFLGALPLAWKFSRRA